MAKKKKKILGPRRKRMTRATRLINAKEWVKSYDGKNIIKGYAKWFGVDWICAMTELEMLGYPFSEKMKEKTRNAVANRNHDKKLKKETRKQKRDQFEENWDIDCDESFAFIAGYTSGGVPFGVTYDEWIEMEKAVIQINPYLMGDLDWWGNEEMGSEDDWKVNVGIDDVEDSYELSDEEIEELIKSINKSG